MSEDRAPRIVRRLDGPVIEEVCTICDDDMRVLDKGLGRARLAAWRTQHQHVTPSANP